MSTLNVGPVTPPPDQLPREDAPTIRNWVGSKPPAPEADAPPGSGQPSSAATRLKRAIDQLPSVGQSFAGFELVAVLGRGTFGRVYLARQGDLADRFVALKISPDLTGESRTLARLQHTNIVPIYSVHRVPPFQAVCMPFYGATTLNHLLTRYRDLAALPSTGRQLVDTLCLLNDETGVSPPGSRRTPKSDGPAVAPESGPESDRGRPALSLPDRPRTQGFLGLLRGMTYTDAVCWIGAQLADGLAHAHALGLVHNDLKPANVLLTDAGQPMLLDFGVADDLAQRALARSIGGTLPYMSPEHIESTRTLVPVTDPRSDLYGLGLILFEMLTGRHPFRLPTGEEADEVPRMLAERRAEPPRVRPLNPSVSPGLEAIVRKCLEPDPARRYQSAADLRDDLDRHRTNRPLRHARVPSVRERLTKWARRHPRLSSNLTLTASALLVIVLLGLGLYARDARIKRYEAEAAARALGDEARADALALDDAVRAAHYATNSPTREPERIKVGIGRGEVALLRYGLAGDAAWDLRPAFQALSADEQQRVRGQLVEACLFLAREYAAKADPGETEADRFARALRMNGLAERAAGGEAPRAVWEQRAELLRRQGDRAGAEKAAERTRSAPLRTGYDHYLSGSELLAAGRYGEAVKLLARAVELDPGYYQSQEALGKCYYQMGKFADAYACYTTTIALRPELPRGYYNRGQVGLRQFNHKQARADFDRAAELAPDDAETHLSRALAAQYLRDYPAAVRDLDRALELGAPKVRVLCMRARVRELAGDKAAADRDLGEALKLEAADEVSLVARGLARVNVDAPGALKDFDAALALDPRSLSALQNKAHMLSKLGRNDDALKALDKLLELYPTYVKALSGRGMMHARAGNLAAAKADAEATLRLDDSPAYRYYVGGIYAQLSRNDPAYKADAIRLLGAGLRGGFGHEEIETDKDLDPIRSAPEFKRVLDGARALKGGPDPR